MDILLQLNRRDRVVRAIGTRKNGDGGRKKCDSILKRRIWSRWRHPRRRWQWRPLQRSNKSRQTIAWRWTHWTGPMRANRSEFDPKPEGELPNRVYMCAQGKLTHFPVFSVADHHERATPTRIPFRAKWKHRSWSVPSMPSWWTHRSVVSVQRNISRRKWRLAVTYPRIRFVRNAWLRRQRNGWRHYRPNRCARCHRAPTRYSTAKLMSSSITRFVCWFTS